MPSYPYLQQLHLFTWHTLRDNLLLPLMLLPASLVFTGHVMACTIPDNSFCVDYFKGKTLAAPVISSETTSAIKYNWQNGSPNPTVPVDNFSGRWQGQYTFAAGQYIFRVLADDGVRLKVDGQIVADGWKDQAATEYKVTLPLTAGSHLIEVEYYEGYGGARLEADWEPVRSCDVPLGKFCVAYFDNPNLTGNPRLLSTETSIDHNWGNSSPDVAVPIEGFSGRWQGSFDFSPGTYAFNTTSDDGVRVRVDNETVIDAWINQGATSYEAIRWLTGRHRITVDYFDAYGLAVLKAGWQQLSVNGSYAPIGSNATSPIGSNLGAWRDWGTDQPFINLFKTSRGWITQAPGVWDTGEKAKLDLDANGWLRSLPVATDASVQYRTVTTVLLNGNDLNGLRPGGDYVVLYEGEGVLSYSLGARKNTTLSRPGRDIITVDKNNGGGIQLTIAQTDPNHTGNYIRNIRVVSSGVVCDDDLLAFCLTATDPTCGRAACRTTEAAVNDRLLQPSYLRALAYYRAFRFMDPFSTNVIDSGQPQLVNWADRATPGKARWIDQAGVPAEVAITLSNQMKTDAWLNMPHRASDDYIRQFAKLAHQTLEPARKVYVEYANEIWNTAFSAGSWVEQQGLALWPGGTDSPYTKRINWYGKRSAEMCDIWKAEWKGDESRITCVVAAQSANTWTASAALDCSLWTAGRPCQAHGLDALAIAPYFGHYLGNPSTEAEVAAWTDTVDGGLGKLFAELTAGGQISGGPAGGALAQSRQWMQQYADLAKSRTLRLLAYEGGQHLVGVGNAANNPQLTSLFVSANRDPRMGDIYRQYLNHWRDITGGDLFVNFSTMGQYGRYGSWGALENMTQISTPKYDALIKHIKANPQ
jgi:PA14 domain